MGFRLISSLQQRIVCKADLGRSRLVQLDNESLLDFIKIFGLSKACHGNTIAIYQEFFKVPSNCTAKEPRPATDTILQELEERMRVGAIYVHLSKVREVGIKPDRAGFRISHLPKKLVARKTEDFQTTVLVFLVELRKSFVIRFGRASQSGNIGNDENLAFVLAE